VTTYYVDSVNGSDANNGLGPDASAVTNKPWQTIGKLLGASGFASGDTAYLSPAGPFREVVTVAMTSATVETKVIGDVANAQGFKTSGGVSVSPGEVQWTAYTTNDKTAPSGSTLLSLAGNDHLTFQNLTMIAGGVSVVAGGTDATDITFTDCAMLGRVAGSTSAINCTASFGTALNWTFNRCRIINFGGNNAMNWTLTTSGSGSDYDINIQVQNCLLMAWGTVINLGASGALSKKGNGCHVKNSTLIGTTAFDSNSANLSNSVANLIYNNLLIASGTGLTASASGGLITEDYNRIAATTARTNVSAGANSITSNTHALLFHFGQELFWGGNLRPFGMPTSGSPLLGFGGNSPTTVDILNNPRPSGGASASTAVGAYERANTFGKETGTVRTGSTAISITGPGTQDFQLDVNAVSTTCTIYVQWDATYAGTKPQWMVLQGSECGVSDATATAAGSSGSWEQLSLNFTPTKAGIVTLRLQSNDTNGGGHMYADDFAVA
jgi:hypothetical protein